MCNRGRLWAAVEEVSSVCDVLALAVMLNLRKLLAFGTSQKPVRLKTWRVGQDAWDRVIRIEAQEDCDEGVEVYNLRGYYM